MVDVTNPVRFHELVKNESAKTQILIYSIDLEGNPSVDFTDRSQVELYGTLLKYNVSDTNSNGRIASSGLVINDWFNKDDEVQVGKCVGNSLEISFINDDGGMASFNWDYPIVMYFEVYDSANSVWLDCPLGVYWFEKPTKTTDVIVAARAFDVMSKLENYDAQAWFNSQSWNGTPPTLQTIWSSIDSLGIAGLKISADAIANGTLLISKPSINITGKTLRDFINWIAGAAGGIARVGRDGVLRIKTFTAAEWPDPNAPGGYDEYYIDYTATPTSVLRIEIAEYDCPIIDTVHIYGGYNNFNSSAYSTLVPSPDNPLYIINNPFIQEQSVTDAMTQNIITELDDIPSYKPTVIKYIGDPAVEAGDYFGYGDAGKYTLVFQQSMVWRGGPFIVTSSCSGYEHRKTPTQEEIDSYQTASDITSAADGEIRADATVTGAGWYRVFRYKYRGIAPLYTGMLVNIRIAQYNDQGSSYSSNHEIDLSVATGGYSFVHEVSNGSSGTHVTKIRVTTDSTYMNCDVYIDGAYSVTAFIGLCVWSNWLSRFEGTSFRSVGAAPTGETVQTTYTFHSEMAPAYLKSYVDSTASNYTIGSGNYVAVPYPTGLNGRNVVSIGLSTWTNNSGPFSIFPYGETNSNWYIIGAAGTTINGAKFRYWYIDN